MQKTKIISPASSISSVSGNSIDYGNLNEVKKIESNKNKLATNAPINKSKSPFILENDENFKNGKRLLIRGKDLKQLNENIFKSNSDIFLTGLEISPDRQSCLDYRLEKLPKNINLFKNLRELKLDTNDLSELPLQIGELNRLERLSLSNNNFKSLPEQSFSKLLSLKSLHLSNNKFDAIPSCLFLLKSLEFLDLTSNEIKKIDKNISKLQNTLKVLMLYDNMIEELTNIHELRVLEVLWIGKNKVKCLPLNLTSVKSLDWKNMYLPLILDNNPLSEPPINVSKLGFDAIKNWYNDKKGNEDKNKVKEKK
jgi:Leucine-rich repeat (LRR) protein